MSLTGPAFLALVVTMTVLGLAGVVAFWPRLAGRGPKHVLARAGLLVTVNLMVLITVLSQLNARDEFFANWTDLAGADSHGYTATDLTRGADAEQAASAPIGPAGNDPRARHPSEATGPASYAPSPLPAGAGLHDYRVTGPASGVDGQIYVDLPSGYTWRSAREYPVLETFSGYPGLPTQWDRTMALPQMLSAAAVAQRIHPTIVVSATTEIPAGVDTECVNGAAGEPQMETWLSQDVPTWVSQHFAVDTGRADWATLGMSAGGWCAAMTAMLHPQRYGAAVVMGGYFHPLFDRYKPFSPNSDPGRRYDLVRLAGLAPPPLALWLETSRADSVSDPTSTALIQASHAPMAVTATVLQNAGHRTGIWEQLLPAALDWLGENIPGFNPAK